MRAQDLDQMLKCYNLASSLVAPNDISAMISKNPQYAVLHKICVLVRLLNIYL